VTDLDIPGLDRMLGQARTALLATRRASSASSAGSEERGVGRAADGQIRAVAAAGRMQSLEFDPQVLRMTPRELADAIVRAVNAALDDWTGRAAELGAAASGVGRVDPQALAAQIAEVQEEGVRQMAAISQAIGDALAQIRAAQQ
jgi:DNA-binding protein YbaB